MLTFFVPGEPCGKARARILRNPKNPRKPAFTPKKTMDAERLIGWEAKRVGAMPIEGPVRLKVVANFSYPKSWSRRRKQSTEWHTSKPDLDNITKLVKDALNKIAWMDDSQVSYVESVKKYTNGEVGLSISIVELFTPL